MRTLAIYKCPHSIYSVSLDDEGGGIRLTPSKCCGHWDHVSSWSMTAEELRELANEFECAADALERRAVE